MQGFTKEYVSKVIGELISDMEEEEEYMKVYGSELDDYSANGVVMDDSSMQDNEELKTYLLHPLQYEYPLHNHPFHHHHQSGSSLLLFLWRKFKFNHLSSINPASTRE